MEQHRFVRSGTLAWLGLVAASGAAQAQQMPRNTTDVPASSGFTENVDFGDIDLDGDWDAVFADGGDNGNDQNKIWRNNGGAQGGTVGVFTNVTASQAPAISDDSRDIEFVDFDHDGDLDIYVSNTAQLSPINNSNRWWANMGGAQGGTTGFYQDQTAARWVGLAGPGSSIAASQLGGNGGFIDFSCDCDFGDVDNDGDLDLFHSTYGGAFGGQVPSRIFLNNGTGQFSEFNPSGFQLPGQTISNGHPGLWCQGTQTANTTNSTGANCDVASTALDIDLGDTDGDLDLDVLHGARQEAPRFFRNLLQENGSLAFRDVTGAVYPAGYTSGSGHYEQEMGDFDADGDLDLYGLNWQSVFNDIVMKNNGAGVFGSLAVLGSSGPDDNEGDFIDYNLDGDLDLFVANFSGQDRMYANNGTGSFTFQSTGTVIPSDGTTSLDADMCDVDDDGDPDLFVANDANQSEWYLKNSTASNDVTAAVLANLEQAPNRSAGPLPTVVRVQVYDNASYYTTWYNPTVLEYEVNGGATQTVPGVTVGGQIFRAEIPGALVGTITYRFKSTDRYNNTGTSATKNYTAVAGGSVGTAFCFGDGSLATPCPCGNNGTAGRGCDNSAATGGAQLTATGSVSPDTVVFQSAGELPTALSIFLQGNAVNLNGVVFGDGVRCAAGSLKRLYVKNAVGGTATAPVAGDPSVTTQSANLGDPITPGQSRWYQVYYRDPNLTFCPAPPGDSFNISSGLLIVW